MFLTAILTVFCLAWAQAQAADWKDLKVTWGPNPVSSKYFQHQPRTKADLIASGNYESVDSSCQTDGTCKGAICGERWQLKGDPSVRLVYGPNGYIVGIQTSVLKTQWNPMRAAQTMAIDDGNYWTLAAYFIDPTTVCKGRSVQDYQNFGTGHGLWVQQVKGAAKQIPMTETAMDGALSSHPTWWTKGKCFYTMGLHYWFNLSTNMKCDDFLPMFVMYNGGALDSFGWAIGTQTAALTSPRYEHPTYSVVPAFMNGAPTCLSTDVRMTYLSTMHIFMDNKWHFC